MLSRLSIKNYALIDEIDIVFPAGLSMITGETGAGKSIILGALSLILGQRSEGKYFYNQQKKCVIEGHFSIGDYQLQDFFTLHDIDYDSQTILRREIHHEGKSRAFINDTPVKLSVLKALGERLIAIHSQHAVLEINTEAFQFLTLDALAGNLNGLLKRYQQEFKAFKAFSLQLEELQLEEKRLAQQADYHQFLFDELEQAGLQDAHEQEKLEEELNVLSHAEEIKRTLQNALLLLSEQEESVLSGLQRAGNLLEQVADLSVPLQELHERLMSCYWELKDIGEEVATEESRTELNEESMQMVQDRLSLIFKLQQKHGATSLQGLIDAQETLSEQLLAVSSNQQELERIEKDKEQSGRRCLELAKELSESRLKAIPKLEKKLHTLLKQAGMPHARFQVLLEKTPDLQLRPLGLEKIEFRFSANPGQELQNVSRVASGGELSRLMLAIKSILARSTALPTIIFDEIDTGISGAIAMKVGDIMQELGEHMQVIAISHLPQIAAKGSAHFKVFKSTEAGGTTTRIEELGKAERILEIAQMLGGSEPSETATQHAKELLG